MRIRLLALISITAFLVASCGTSRDADSASGATDASGGTAVTDGTGGTEPTVPGDPTTTGPTAPVTTAPDDEVAVTMVFADGTEGEILHGDLNAVAVPTRANDEFVNLVYGPEVPAGFEAVVLSQAVWSRVLERQLTAENTTPSEENEAEAKGLLIDQLTPLFTTSSDPAADSERLYGEVPYLPFIVELQSRQIALSNLLKARAPEAEQNPCVSHILVATEEEANQVLADLEGGADFATLAAEVSTDTASGALGGELDCVASSNYVPEFAAAVDGATVGEYVGPVQSQFGFHVLIVTGLEADGDALAQAQLESGLESTTITVDERIGTWDAENQRITPAGS